MSRRLPSLSPLALVLVLAACSKTSGGDQPAAPAPQEGLAITAKSSGAGVLTLAPTLRDDGLLLSVHGAPDGSSLECHLDGAPLAPCTDGGLYNRPPTGDHRITAVALRGGQIVALGQSKSFTVLPGTAGVVTKGDARSALAMVPDDPTFTNGATVPLAKDFTARFRLAAKPPCDQPQIRCRYDSRASQFWTACDKGDQTFTVGKDQLALGLQYLSVQATCSDQAGDVLTLFWYGVPDNYQPLLLKDLADSNGRHVVNLVKSDDCPESQQRFECAAGSAPAFTLCQTGNVVDQPAHGDRVRVRCGDRAGPPLTF